ncbi:MAG: ABC transporter permease [Acidobacteria bacterium]|nr:ABC transporter permease [Acidobacteriota bacterium]
MKQWSHEFLLRLRALFSKRRLDREMADELAFHQQMLKEKLVQQGVPVRDAERVAQLRFGNDARWHERLRELWQFRWPENMRRDIGYSIRVLRKSPGFTAIAILTLALGVGANTTVFSIVNGLLLRPLPVPESDRLVILEMLRGFPDPVEGFSEPMFRALENRHDSFAEVFATFHTEAEIKGESGTERAHVELVSGDFFAGLQSPPLMGRVLTRADDRKGGDLNGFAVVIGEGFWQRWFNRSPNVIGEKLRVDNTLFTVVGVMPKRFIGEDPLQRPEIFVPLAAEPAMDGDQNLTTGGLNAWWLTIMARLQPGVTMEQANARLAAESGPILRQVNADQSWIEKREKEHFRLVAESGSTGYTYTRMVFRKPLAAVFAMCGGVLLLACLNLASLLMARGAARQRELATKLSMGATRARLVQQLLVESLLISLAGTVFGLVMAPWVGESLSAMLLAGQFETNIDTNLDLRVFAFAAAIAVVATLLVGLVPALQATSSGLNEQMKQGQHTTQAHERQRLLPRVMMAIEVGLALLLVVGAGLLTSSLIKLYRSGAGFDARGLESIAVSMDHQSLRGEALMQFYRQVGEELKRQPGVKSVSWQWVVPLAHMTWDENFYALGGREEDIHENAIAPEYFKSMHIPLLSGRDFRWDDRASSGQKVIINRTAAKLLFRDRDAVGQTINKKNEKKVIPYEVIGVVGDAKYEDVRSAAPPTIYHAMTQGDKDQAPSFNAVVRMDGSASGLAAAARSIVQKINPEIPAPKVSSMETMVDESLSAERTMALLSAFFALCALGVTAVGLYGTLAYSTARRTTEIGIRMALGAKRTQVARMVFAQNSAIALAGTSGGLACAFFGSKLLASFLYGTSVRDPWIFAGSIMILALIASAASLLPALRAARIEPMRAIRCE